MGRWHRALVTGASAGIGAALARQLAAEGVHLVLVARRVDRLDALRDELASTGVGVEVLVADLAIPDGVAAVVRRVAADGAPIDLLVNNAGFGSRDRLWERPPADASGQIGVNVGALVALSHAAAGVMVERGAGTILNVSSIAGLQPSPGHAVYAATKAFVTNFGESLSMELRGTGVRVSTSCPGLTHTEFHEVSGRGAGPGGPAWLWMGADAVARDALDAAARGRVVRVHGMANRALALVSQHLPRSVKRAVVGRVLGRSSPARSR